MNEPTFKPIFGDAWDNLPPVIKKHYANRPYTNDKVTVEGIFIYSIWWGNCPFIELIKVNETYQRQGIGTQLLKAAKAEIHSKGFKQLISSTEVINDMGLAFHENHRFKPLNPLDLPHGEEQFYSLDLKGK